jgi:hypothetical protein
VKLNVEYAMQPLRHLMQSLTKLGNAEHCLFTPDDLHSLFPKLSAQAFKTLLSRAVKGGYLQRICRGLYHYPQVAVPTGLLLFHTAARLRASEFNYISLETALSEAGVISQIPINWISIMSSGRSNVISCGEWGTIEFIHTNQRPSDLADQLHYDARCKLWRASVNLALRDMRVTHRSLDLINWSLTNEFV